MNTFLGTIILALSWLLIPFIFAALADACEQTDNLPHWSPFGRQSIEVTLFPDLVTPQCSSGENQSRPFPARSVKPG